jgi:hypothetical protein
MTSGGKFRRGASCGSLSFQKMQKAACGISVYIRPHLLSSPPGEEMTFDGFWFADERPANPVLNIFKEPAKIHGARPVK